MENRYWTTLDGLRWFLFSIVRREVEKILTATSPPNPTTVEVGFDLIFKSLEEKWKNWKQIQEKSCQWSNREIWGFEGVYYESLFYLCALKEEIKSKISDTPDKILIEVLPLWPKGHIHLPYYHVDTVKLEKAEIPVIDADFVILQSYPWVGEFRSPVFIDVKRSEPRFSDQEKQRLKAIASSVHACTVEIAWPKIACPQRLDEWEYREVCSNCGALMARVGKEFPEKCPWCKTNIVRWYSREPE